MIKEKLRKMSILEKISFLAVFIGILTMPVTFISIIGSEEQVVKFLLLPLLALK